MTSSNHYEYLIIGAGPAGLQLAYYLNKFSKNYVLLEKSEAPGYSFDIYPRHRKLISINKVYTGYDDREVNYRHDWNSLLCDDDDLLFKQYSKEYFPDAGQYVRYLEDFAKNYNLNIDYEKQVKVIKKSENFAVETECGTIYSAEKVIVCTGVSKPYIPAIKGIELTENYQSVSVSPEDFTNQTVLVIGKGNSGFETADNLIAHSSTIHIVSPTPLNLAWKSHFVGHLRAVNNNFLDSYQLKSQNAVLDAEVVEIFKRDNKFHVTFNYVQADEQETIVYDRVICCTGFRFDSSIFDESCKPELAINNRFPSLTYEWESKNVQDLFFAGTITQSLDYKKSTSGFVHGFRYSAKALYSVLERKYHGQPLTENIGVMDSKEMTNYLIGRINRTSALWQQYGFLGDIMVFNKETGHVEYAQEISVGQIKNEIAKKYENLFMLTLEYGPKQEDPFNAKRVSPDDLENANQSSFLHPVIRHFNNGNFSSEHHIIENLAGEWFKDEHVNPLLKYIQSINTHTASRREKMTA